MATVPEPDTVRYPRLLKAARILFVVYTVSLILLYLISLPGYFEQVSMGTVADIAFDISQPIGNAFFDSRAAAAGLTVDNWLIAHTASVVFILAVHLFTAGLIFWRLPRSWFALLSAYVIMIIGTSTVGITLQASGLSETLGPWANLLYSLGGVVWPILPIWLYLFPDGRPVPRWPLWPLAILMGIFLIFQGMGILYNINLLPPAMWDWIRHLSESFDFVLALVFPALVLALGSQVYRYWRVSGPVERQQTKWFVLGLSLFILTFFVPENLPVISQMDAVNSVFLLTIIPITIAIALLRYRLWDADVIIRRTTSYAILTGILLLVYLGSIIILQSALTPISGDSDVAIVASTLLIAALFLPLRRRVQATIDRRFFRQKYDAEKVLEQFAATVRDETDLDTLTSELLRVIQETMQPSSLSIWLNDLASAQSDTSEQRQSVVSETPL